MTKALEFTSSNDKTKKHFAFKLIRGVKLQAPRVGLLLFFRSHAAEYLGQVRLTNMELQWQDG